VAAVPSVAAERQQTPPGPPRHRLCQVQCIPCRRESWSALHKQRQPLPRRRTQHVGKVGICSWLCSKCNLVYDPCCVPSGPAYNDSEATGGSPQHCAGHDVIVITLQKVQQAGVRRAAGCLHGQWPLQASALMCASHIKECTAADSSSASGHSHNRSAPAAPAHARPEPMGGRQCYQPRHCRLCLVMQGRPGSTVEH
jgi:hypothetical protein